MKLRFSPGWLKLDALDSKGWILFRKTSTVSQKGWLAGSQAEIPSACRRRRLCASPELQRHPHLLLKLAENALVVAESLRDNYFKNTAKFVSILRRAIQETLAGKRTEAILVPQTVGHLKWSDVQGEVVTFIDGGIGSVQISSQVPILLRVGSYSVRTGERRLAEREQFGYYPVILGDLQGGSKERKDFPDVIRITPISTGN